MVTIYSDGGSRGNPGKAACAYVIYDENKKLIKQDSKYLGKTTNNVAEYSGVIEALKYALRLPEVAQGGKIRFCSDSELVVKQLTGMYKIRDAKLMELSLVVKKIISDNNLKVDFQHVPRAENGLADNLVNENLDDSSRL